MTLPLVLLPGMMCDARLFAPQIAALSAGRSLICADLSRADSMADLAAMVLADAPRRFALAGLSMGGALVLRLAADVESSSQVAGVVVVNPAVATKRLDVKLLPVLKHVVKSFPGITDDIKKPGVTEHGYPRAPLKAVHSMMRAWPVLVADLPQVTAPVLYARSAVDHVVDESSEPLITSRVSSRDVTVLRLPESYHVATLDNDLPLLVEETAAFVARVTSG